MKTNRMRYEVRAAAEEEAEVWIYGEIGPDWYGDGSRIDAQVFAKDFAAITAPRINLRVNSPGGSVSHGMAMYNAILRHPATVTAYIDGQALSAASLVVLAGDEVVMAENAMYMIHDPGSALLGYFGAADLRKEADTLDKYAETMVTVYRRKTGMSAEELGALMEAETWYTAEEALEAGFIDRVSDDGNAPEAFAFDLERFGYKHVPEMHRRGDEPAASEPESPPPASTAEVPTDSGDVPVTLRKRAVELLTLRQPGYGGHDG